MKAILKSVSRSFYLTISFLPRPLREPVSLAYLLARATDTIADTATVPAAIRLTTLRDFARVIAGELDFNAVAEALQDFAAQQSDPHERTLIENLRECIEWLAKLDPADRDDIRGVLKTIVSGPGARRPAFWRSGGRYLVKNGGGTGRIHLPRGRLRGRFLDETGVSTYRNLCHSIA